MFFPRSRNINDDNRYYRGSYELRMTKSRKNRNNQQFPESEKTFEEELNTEFPENNFVDNQHLRYAETCYEA